MQNNIQTVLLRTAFRASFLFIGAIIIFANVVFYFYEQRGELKVYQKFNLTKGSLHFKNKTQYFRLRLFDEKELSAERLHN